MWSIGVDTGGTFTDLVVFDSNSNQIRSSKSLSTHKTPVAAFSKTLEQLKINRLKIIKHLII